MVEATGTSDVLVTLLLTVGAPAVVCVPLVRGLRIVARALAATRPLDPAELERRLRRGEGPETVALEMLRVLASALRENERAGHPTEFLIDASRQYATHGFEERFVRPLSMYANLCPPIGLIGTVAGLLVLFSSIHVANESLELGALALALTASLFALGAFTVLEGMKIRLYGRLRAGLDDALAVFRRTRAAA
jgi:hypothetical protein